MDESYRYLRVQVQVEQQRFLSFAMEAGLLHTEKKLCATLQVNHVLLINILKEINSLFKKYEKKNKKYVRIIGRNNVSWGDECEPQTNLMELLCVPSADSSDEDVSTDGKKPFSLSRSFRKVGFRTAAVARAIRTIATEPRRLVWVSVDQEEFEVLVVKLKDLNSILIGLLHTSGGKKLEKAVEKNYLELLQLRNDVQSLRALIKALGPTLGVCHRNDDMFHSAASNDPISEAARVEGLADEAKRQSLLDLAKLKLRHMEIDQPHTVCASTKFYDLESISLDLSVFNISEDYLHQSIHSQERRLMTSWNNQSVWFEWIEQSSNGFTVESPSEKRVALLTRLLCDGIPSGFRAPKCLGYVKSSDCEPKFKFGIVFERPSGLDTKMPLTTLRQLLATTSIPSLTNRLSLCSALADCLFSFHAVDWLHKGLRSDNILFFSTGTTRNTLASPYITGYDLSRPSEVSEMTEKPPFDPLSDLYRHPHAQFGEWRNSYRKAYDIYSLGVILIEIALWEPIENILGFKDLARLEPKKLRGIRDGLLGVTDDDVGLDCCEAIGASPDLLMKIANQCGDSYRDVVEICLEATEVEKQAYRGESYASTRSRLRVMFQEQVSDKLGLMKDVLSSAR